MADLKPVLVITGVYKLIPVGEPETSKDYILACVAAGLGFPMFQNPHITTAFYTEGTGIAGSIDAAILTYNASKTDANLGFIKDKVALGVIWLDSYAEQVIAIANDPANCATREEASNNIKASHLTPQKLGKSDKGTPDKAIFTATGTGTTIEIEITNTDFIVSNIIVIAIEMPPVTDPATPAPSVTLTDGQVFINNGKAALLTVTKTFSGKNKSLKLKSMNVCDGYNLYIYSMNGNKQISELSEAVPVILKKPK